MGIDGRVATLEHRWRAPCPGCAALPRVARVTGGERAPETPASCPVCGKRAPTLIVLVTDDRPWEFDGDDAA